MSCITANMVTIYVIINIVIIFIKIVEFLINEEI